MNKHYTMQLLLLINVYIILLYTNHVFRLPFREDDCIIETYRFIRVTDYTQASQSNLLFFYYKENVLSSINNDPTNVGYNLKDSCIDIRCHL